METLYKKVYITRWVFEECTSDSQQTPEILEEIEIIKKTSFIKICEIVKSGTVTHDNELSPGDDEIKKNSVPSVSSVAKINFMAGTNATRGQEV